MTVRTRTRRGQALMELAIGMLVILTLLASSFVFVSYIVRSLRIQNHLRSDAKVVADKIDLTDFEQKVIFGMKSLKIKEPVGSVDRGIRE